MLRRAGINEVTMVDNCMLAAIGAELNVRHNYGGTVVSIGGGVTEMAVVGLCGLIDGMAMNVGGMPLFCISATIAGEHEFTKSDCAGLSTAWR